MASEKDIEAINKMIVISNYGPGRPRGAKNGKKGKK